VRSLLRPSPGGGVEDAPVGAQDLGDVAGAARVRGAGVAQAAVRLLDERADVRRPRAQAAVDRAIEVGAQVQVEEQAGGGEHDGHDAREGQREAQPDRRSPHVPVPSARRRYPTPRMVSMLCVAKGTSMRSRNRRTWTSTTFERFS
jgi:hypothetical protein